MVDNNFLNLTEHNLDDKIYRIFPLMRFLELLKSNRNTLVNPSLWSDKFENLALSADINIVKGNSLTLENRLGKSIYCQCWSLEEESVPMWEIYSKDCSSIKVSTTIRKLFHSIYDEYGELYDTFIGKAFYYPEEYILDYIKSNSLNWISDRSGVSIGKSLLLKRDIFSHEKEIRLVHNTFGKIENDIIQYDINPNNLFDEIVFDSRLSENEYQKNKKSILDMGWKNSISKSEIYDYPKDFKL